MQLTVTRIFSALVPPCRLEMTRYSRCEMEETNVLVVIDHYRKAEGGTLPAL